MNEHLSDVPVKRSKRAVATMIAFVGCAVGLMGFGWHVYPTLNVVAKGETWLSSNCHLVKNGFSTLLLAATNPIDDAKEEIKSGQYRFMPTIYSKWPRFSEKYQSSRPHGIECRDMVPIRDPFGSPHFGDMIENKCALFDQIIQSCLVEAYNKYIYEVTQFPGKENCVWTAVPPRTSCSGVEAEWKTESNKATGK